MGLAISSVPDVERKILEVIPAGLRAEMTKPVEQAPRPGSAASAGSGAMSETIE